jgi:hypothetical protein
MDKIVKRRAGSPPASAASFPTLAQNARIGCPSASFRKRERRMGILSLVQGKDSYAWRSGLYA